jgi:hypothetical protein
MLVTLVVRISSDRGVGVYLQAYGGMQKACKDILLDFFTHAFDGYTNTYGDLDEVDWCAGLELIISTTRAAVLTDGVCCLSER